MPCLTPFAKKNPNYGLKKIGLNFFKDCESQYINIPCGYCPNCIALKQMYMVQRVQMEALVNHMFFATLTYNDDFLPSLDVNDFCIKYADMRDLTLSIKRIRNNNLFGRDFRYFAVSEFGSSRGRPHFHVLFMLPKFDDDDLNTCLTLEKRLYDVVKSNWTVNIGSKRVPKYVPRFTHVQKFVRGRLKSNYDLHYIRPNLTSNGVSDCAFYVLKYMMKDSSRSSKLQQALRLNLEPHEYDSIWNLVKPCFHASKGFGLGSSTGVHVIVKDYLRSCIDKSPLGSPYPFYFNPDNGMSFPLCPYYRKNSDIFTLKDMYHFYYNSNPEFEMRDNDKAILKFKDYAKKVSYLESTGDVIDFDDLF